MVVIVNNPGFRLICSYNKMILRTPSKAILNY